MGRQDERLEEELALLREEHAHLVSQRVLAEGTSEQEHYDRL